MGGQRTAGVVIIGNEILSGKVEERNARFLIEALRAIGVRLREVAVVEDDRLAIGAAVRRMAEAYDIVCTTGGIGPTHDDITIEAIAAGFDVPVVESPELVAAMSAHLGAQMGRGHRRMARIPAGAVLMPAGGKIPWPTIRLDNVWIFPGIPSLLRAKFCDLSRHLGAGSTVYTAALHLAAEEADICEALDALVARHGDVEVGSYPAWDGRRWTIQLTVEALSRAAVQAAWDDLRVTFAGAVDAEHAAEPVTFAGRQED